MAKVRVRCTDDQNDSDLILLTSITMKYFINLSICSVVCGITDLNKNECVAL